MKKRFVLFDMDGVLLDSEPGAFGFWHKALAARGYEVPTDEILKLVGHDSRTCAQIVIDQFHIPEEVDEFMNKNRSFGNYYRDDTLDEFPGLNDFLDELMRRNIKIAVVSSSRAMSVMYALDRLNLVHYCSAIIFREMLENSKPDPEGYLKAAAFLGASPGECVVIEDSPTGIQAGINAGMKVAAFTGSVIQQDISKAALQFGSYAEGLQMIEQILE